MVVCCLGHASFVGSMRVPGRVITISGVAYDLLRGALCEHKVSSPKAVRCEALGGNAAKDDVGPAQNRVGYSTKNTFGVILTHTKAYSSTQTLPKIVNRSSSPRC